MSRVALSILLGMLLAPCASAEVVVTPAHPTPGDTVTIRLENHFGMQATVESASITRTGNVMSV